MNQDDKDQLKKLKKRAFEAAPILREAGYDDLAGNLLLNTGFAIGLAHRLDGQLQELMPSSICKRCFMAFDKNEPACPECGGPGE